MNMKMSLLALCGALSLAAFAEEAAPAAPAKPARPMRGPRQTPTMLVIDGDTSPEKVAAFKAEVAKKVDEAMASYAAKPEGEKRAIRLVLFSNEGMMGPRGEGRGPRARGEGNGPRGERPRRPRPVKDEAKDAN